jgi:multiple sugar transport system permease protein
MENSRKGFLSTAVGSIVVTFFALLCVAPLIYMLLMSFTQLRTLRIRLEDITFNLDNSYSVIVNSNSGLALVNSLLVAVASCVWTVMVCAMAAYGFEKKPVPGKEKIFKVYLATMMVPAQVTLIPLFLIMRQIGWLNSYWALIIPMAGAFGCFMLRQFMKSIDDAYIESAQMDGCPEFMIFLRIILPLVQPAVISLTIFTFVASWNSFIWPLVVNTNTRMYTFPVALSLLDVQHDTNFGLSMAAATVSFLVPFAMYATMQKQFVEGIALGGVKG